MNRALFMIMQASYLASTVMTSQARADLAINFNLPECRHSKTWNVPHNTNIAIIGPGAPQPSQVPIQGARDLVAQDENLEPTAKDLSAAIHTKNIAGSMIIFGADINMLTSRYSLIPNMGDRIQIIGQPTDRAALPSISGGVTPVGYTTTINAEKLHNDIATMQNNGTPANTIKYIFSLDGITIPDEVLAGGKSVQEAIADGSLTQGGPPTTWTPPIMQPPPTPDLMPRGSSAPNWSPNAAVPTFQQLRQSIMSRPRPPDC